MNEDFKVFFFSQQRWAKQMKCRYCDFEAGETLLRRHLNKEHREQREKDFELLRADLAKTETKLRTYYRLKNGTDRPDTYWDIHGRRV